MTTQTQPLNKPEPRHVIAVVKLNDLEDYLKRNHLENVRITITDQGLIMEEKSQNDPNDIICCSYLEPRRCNL